LYNSVWTLETNTSEAQDFFLQICTLAEQVMRNTLLGVWSNSLLINFEKLLTELNGSHYTELENLNLNLDFEFQ
jgi:hypothetical protein